MSELKNCPLCSGMAEYVESDDGDWAVCCLTRGCLFASWAVSEAIWQTLPRWSAMRVPLQQRHETGELRKALEQVEADLDQANVRVVKLELRDMETAKQVEAHYRAQCVAEDLRNVARDERDAALRKVKKLQNMVDCTTRLCQKAKDERDETRAEYNALEALLERRLTTR